MTAGNTGKCAVRIRMLGNSFAFTNHMLLEAIRGTGVEKVLWDQGAPGRHATARLPRLRAARKADP